jgi:hypothetical protein
MQSTPIIRARVYSYLYYGLKRFKMHAVVEIVPLLLHTSLILFFGGLVAFLHPVNPVVMAVASGLLGLITTIYFGLTVLPLFYLDCPYRTPLSGSLWRLMMTLSTHLRPRTASITSETIPEVRKPDPDTAVEAMTKRAALPSDERHERDRAALIWTVKSLVDESELEPFVESIPDAVWSVTGRRHLLDDHIRALVFHPDVRLGDRIGSLLRTASSGLLSADAQIRREISCWKALWAIASLNLSDDSHSPFNVSTLLDERQLPSAVLHYSVSARALIQWSAAVSIQNRIVTIVEDVKKSGADILRGLVPNMERLAASFTHLSSSADQLRLDLGVNLATYVGSLYNADPSTLPSIFSQIEEDLGAFQRRILWVVFFQYLQITATLDRFPYNFNHTWALLRRSLNSLPWDIIGPILSRTIDVIVLAQKDVIETQQDIHHVDRVLAGLLPYWKPEKNTTTTPPIASLIYYLRRRKSDDGMALALHRCETGGLLLGLTVPLSRRTLKPKHVLEALWIVLVCKQSDSGPIGIESAERALATVVKAPSAPASPSTVLLLKSRILWSLGRPLDYNETTLMNRLLHNILPTPTGVEELVLSSREQTNDILRVVLNKRIAEAEIVLLGEFLETCTSSEIPFRAVETVQKFGNNSFYLNLAVVHPTHQARFANSIRRIFQFAPRHSNLLRVVADLPFFDVYDTNAPAPLGLILQDWLTDSESRHIVKDSLEAALLTLSESDLVSRLQRILQGLGASTMETRNEATCSASGHVANCNRLYFSL